MASLRAVLCLCVVATLASCSQRRDRTGIIPCPLLVGAGGSYGGFASVGDFAEGTCVEVWHDGERLSRAHAREDGRLAVQFVVPEELPDGALLELRISADGGEHVEVRHERFTTRSSALIEYEPHTTPLLAEAAGTLVFRGWLEPTTAIDRAWFVNWTTGAVAEVLPTPAGAPFEARVPGSRGDCATIISQHRPGAGGCWWPRGGGGCAPICTEEEFRAGLCPTGGVCSSPRGCQTLDVDERRSDLPPPERDDAIPVLPPPPTPRDAGTDAPLPDALPADLDAEPF